MTNDLYADRKKMLLEQSEQLLEVARELMRRNPELSPIVASHMVCTAALRGELIYIGNEIKLYAAP